MGYYIIIRGPLGLGKSTISKALAKILKGAYISVDKVLEKNKLDKRDEKLGCISPQNFIKADKIILPEVEERLAKGKIIIFDGCFYHKEQIKHLIDNLPYKHYVFTLKAPLEVCIKRDSKRKRVYGEGAAMAVHGLVSRFDYGTIIDTNNKTEKEVIDEILTHIK